MRSLSATAFLLASVVATLGTSTPGKADDFFRVSVAPVFQKHCLSCHNETQSGGDLSLETSMDLIEGGLVEPGDAEASALLHAIQADGGRSQMPKNAAPLAQEEIEAIRKWIDAGAIWPADFALEEHSVDDFDWWSYAPLIKPALPQRVGEWATSDIDLFIAAKHRELNLKPTAPADRRTLLRRVTFDLTGLPPTPQQMRAFLDDREPGAYERVVSRLLDSEQYGERWARHWLDVVKYADTCGYDKDKLRPNAWPYRDYVIRAFNTDKPYSRFVQEQVAGDVLFPGDPDGVLGLGFIAAGPWDFIGHVEVPESKIDGLVARNLDRDDMVSNTMNTFCSLTIQCARCHNHKFDPITQEHYYGLQAVFAAVDRAERPYDLDPEIETQRAGLESELQVLLKRQDDLEREIETAGGPTLIDLEKSIKQLEKGKQLEKSPEYGYHSAIAHESDDVKWVEVVLPREAVVSSVRLHPCHDDYAGIGAGFGFPVRFTVDVQRPDEPWKTILDRTKEDFENPGLAVVATECGEAVKRIRVTAHQLAERKNDFIFALAELEILAADGSNLARGATVSAHDSIEAPARWGRDNLIDGKWPSFSDLQAAEQLKKALARRTALLGKIVTPERKRERDEILNAVKRTRAQISALPQGRMVYAAATRFPAQSNFKPTLGKLRAVNVLHRGNVQQPLEQATPGFVPLAEEAAWQIPATLDESERRAELARWLTSKDNPFVWRSIVNRIWQYHFGQGLVATPNDFGRMGASPTHPELLDWLAIEFRDGPQSIKQLHRAIVISSVYRQASTQSDRNASRDGSNQYLWRMNRRRLEAEEIRDSILAVSGALQLEMGGPGFYLFELEKTDHSPHYEYYKFDPSDPESHRRSIYRFVVRSQPDPWMTTLDCADSSQSTPRRNETLTSLQALSLLNNRFNLVMAEKFAARLRGEHEDLPDQLASAFELTVQRQPTSRELGQLQEYATEFGLENACRLLFNLSEFVFLD